MANEVNSGFILNWKKPMTIQGNYESGFPNDNVASKYPTKIMQSTIPNFGVKMTFDEPWKMTGLAVINHTLKSGGFQIEFFTDNFITLDATYWFYATEKNTFCILDDSVGEYQYIKLWIQDFTQSFLQIGAIYTGTAFQFPKNYNWGYNKEFRVLKEVDTTDGGYHEETPEEEETIKAAEYSTFDINFSSVDPSAYDLYKNLIRVGSKVFIPDFQKSECYYGIVGNKNLKAQRSKSGDSYSIQFLEHSTIGSNQ